MTLLQWWNLVFLLPAAAALLYLLLMALGAAPMEGHDADIDLDLDNDVDTHIGHAGFDGDGHGHGGFDPFRGALSLIGVGRIPLSLVLMSFAFLWGFFGWVGNQFFGTLLRAPALFIWPSLVLAFVASSVLTRFLAVGLGRLMPATESYGAAAQELVGRLADVRYPLTETSGTVQLYDRHGTLHEVPARVLPGEDAIPVGVKVVLWRYNEPAAAYLAVADEALSGAEAFGLPGRHSAIS